MVQFINAIAVCICRLDQPRLPFHHLCGIRLAFHGNAVGSVPDSGTTKHAAYSLLFVRSGVKLGLRLVTRLAGYVCGPSVPWDHIALHDSFLHLAPSPRGALFMALPATAKSRRKEPCNAERKPAAIGECSRFCLGGRLPTTSCTAGMTWGRAFRCRMSGGARQSVKFLGALVLATQREHSRPVEVKQREEYMRKITIILSLLFFAVAFGVANAQAPRGYYCLSGFKFCPTVMQCVPLDYPCPNRARRR